METPHIISSDRNTSYIVRVRSVMTFVGIVTAIICSLVFLQDFNSTGHVELTAPRLMETSKFGNVDLVVKVASTVWALR